MKRNLPWLILILATVWLASNWMPKKAEPDGFDLAAFGKLPILADGRVKPLDTVARNSLVIIRGKQSILMENGEAISAIRWLADVLFSPRQASKYPAFVINNPEVLGLFGWQQTNHKYFTYAELTPFLDKIDQQGQKAGDIESSQRSPFQTGIFNLRNSLILYQHLENSLEPDDTSDFAGELNAYAAALPGIRAAIGASEKGGQADMQKLEMAKRYQTQAEMSSLLAVPPAQAGGDWLATGASLVNSISSGEINPIVKAYALIGDAYRAGSPGLFNQQVNDLGTWMAKNQPRASGRCDFEFLFNRLAPFYQSMSLYVLAFLLVACSWLGNDWSRSLNRSAFHVLLLALAVHTFGLVSRMYIQERPPVTNLYSSAVFIGWGTVIISLVLERIYRDGVGSACASAIGFITLIIAHHLAGSGDTLEMLQAVLDTNIWLATHVVVVTTGYSAMFLAGMLAIIYVVRGVFTRSLTKESAQALTRMTYGVICFATLFSFVGTVLGGIWADQSWGRFWGWDPKENGALLIVLWCALILHLRWGGYIRQRGIMMMAIFGNVITSFSWFGVNMLGVGLHSYGFMDKAFPWLVGFIVSQMVLMFIAALPLRMWRSFAEVETDGDTKPGEAARQMARVSGGA
jgi:ABC-type transport system involved in cytochrome c biogenesis permease subunit